MYLCGLDLSKAYDRVSCYRLFNKLLKLECPIYVVKFLNAWYVDQQMRIKWNNRLSQPFGVRNGLRQGSVLSPILFNVYIDDLLQQLEKRSQIRWYICRCIGLCRRHYTVVTNSLRDAEVT